MIQYEKVNGSFDLTGKTAIVIGGAGGIGEATARMYANKGAKIVIADCKDNCPEVAYPHGRNRQNLRTCGSKPSANGQ